jgi:S-formylglutathione hydrolase FrmB
MTLDIVSQSRCFGGAQFTYQHQSSETGTAMRFAAFVPPRADQRPALVVWYLSGLTCTEENFTVKAGAQRSAAELGLLLIAPARAGIQCRATRLAHTTSDWAPDFTSMQRNRRGPETTEWPVTLSVSFPD